eukprot:Tbor_TRINITY_DN5204_c0_g1::TRINITY_DN5204_c0_g1_i1::g.16239::m.16239
MNGNSTSLSSLHSPKQDMNQKRESISMGTSSSSVGKRSISPLKSPETPKSMIKETQLKHQWNRTRNNNNMPSPNRSNIKGKKETPVKFNNIISHVNVASVINSSSTARKPIISPKRVCRIPSPDPCKREIVIQCDSIDDRDNRILTKNLEYEVSKLEELTKAANETTVCTTLEETKELKDKIDTEASVVERLLLDLMSRVLKSKSRGCSQENPITRKAKGKRENFSCQKIIPSSSAEKGKSRYSSPNQIIGENRTKFSKTSSIAQSANIREGRRRINIVQKDEGSSEQSNKVNKASAADTVLCSSGPLKCSSASDREALSRVSLETAHRVTSPWPSTRTNKSRSPIATMPSKGEYSNGDNVSFRNKVLPHRQYASPSDSPVVFDFDHQSNPSSTTLRRQHNSPFCVSTERHRQDFETPILSRKNNEHDQGMISIVGDTYLYRLKLEALLAKAVQQCDEEEVKKNSDPKDQNVHYSQSCRVLSPNDVKAMIFAELKRVEEIEQGTRACIIEMMEYGSSGARSLTPTASQFTGNDRVTTPLTDGLNETGISKPLPSLCPLIPSTYPNVQNSTEATMNSTSPSSPSRNNIRSEKHALLRDIYQYMETLHGLLDQTGLARGLPMYQGSSAVTDGRGTVLCANSRGREEDNKSYAQKLNELREGILLEIRRMEEILQFCTN